MPPVPNADQPPDPPPGSGGEPLGSALADLESACADARGAREAADVSRDALRSVRREHAEATRSVELALRESDRHGMADRKNALVAAWRAAMAVAPDDEARRAATATWMGSVSELNRRTRAALRRVAAGRHELLLLERRLAAADLAAAAARIRAESAEAACIEARRMRVERDEANVTAARAATAGAPAAQSGTASEAPEPDEADGAEVDEAAPVRTAVRCAADSGTVRDLMAGDPARHQAVAAELAEMSGQVPARYLLLLDTLVEELTAAALDAGAIAFDRELPMWGSISPTEARLVMRGLHDLGFRLDLHDGWYGGRAPTTADLAAALGFAGLDVRSIRGIPSATELRDLPAGVLVAAHDHLRVGAPDLTLDQVMRLLGPRATGLDELWDDWGRLRPILAEELPARV